MVGLNAPTEFGGFWFFQAQWDPPTGPRFEGDRPSSGYNYTMLGVGNRQGVQAQLVGCMVAVLGMIYAFYVKPVIKRRRRDAVMSRLHENGKLAAAAVDGGRSGLFVPAETEVEA